MLDLLAKYDKAIPRYTSYPTVPYWEPATLTNEIWKQAVSEAFKREKGELCLYIHLPYCENLCTFCACNKRITKNHQVEGRYIETLLKEWNLYLKILGGRPVIREIHLGGGTPTFFSPANLSLLLQGITKEANVPAEHEFGVEVHPNYTRKEHLETLFKEGFTRLSLGVQDFDPEVQYIINRIQSFEQTREVVEVSRKLGYKSVNIDLVYGLPRQTKTHIEYTVGQVRQLMPERIAFYSYAHVPWKSKGQRRYTEADLPSAEHKWEMYQRGRELLLSAGYLPIGMDHFALPGDKLQLAEVNGKLHRNFMGYTTTQSKLLLGLGASSISDTWEAFAQNEKEVEAYEDRVEKSEMPIITGHYLNEEDLLLRKHILELMGTHKTRLPVEKLEKPFYTFIVSSMAALESDGLVQLNGNDIQVTEKGKMFIRNICAALDARLWRKGAESKLFSKAI